MANLLCFLPQLKTNFFKDTSKTTQNELKILPKTVFGPKRYIWE